MKKVGILSFHGADNYGAVLQNYGLQQAVISLGHSVETIDYKCEKIVNSYHVWRQLNYEKHALRKVKNRVADVVNYQQAAKRKKRFVQFRETYLCLSEKVYDSKNISEAQYDLFITGSDQVWNKNIIGMEDTDVYTLAFTGEKKAAYAASCGDIAKLVDQKDSIAQLLKITVREKELCDELKKNNIQSEIVCDPVFLLEKARWLKLAGMISAKNQKYVFMYCVCNSEITLPIARLIADRKEWALRIPGRYNKSIVRSGKCKRVFSDGPLEFLAEIEGAEVIVTSSFHGTAFSLLLEKEFVAVLPESGSRVRNLLQFLGLEERIVSDLDEFRQASRSWNPIDYSKITPKIKRWRIQSLEQLKEICEL